MITENIIKRVLGALLGSVLFFIITNTCLVSKAKGLILTGSLQRLLRLYFVISFR